MYKISELKELLKNKKMSEKFSGIYGGDKNSIEEAYSRLSSALDEFQKIDKSENIFIFSASGRTELSGNHTDHNNGCVLTASINLDKLAVVSKREDNKIIVYTNGYDNPDLIDINNLEIDKKEFGDAHAHDGYCKMTKKAKVSGEIKKGKFYATSFKYVAPAKKD